MKISDEALEAAAERFRADGHSTLGCGLYDLEKTTRDALEAAAPLMLDREAVDAALRTVITWVDYDLHKSLERDEETGEDMYGEHVDRFIEVYEREVGE